VVLAVSQNAFEEIVYGKKVHQLRENSAADIHRTFFFVERNWNGYAAVQKTDPDSLSLRFTEMVCLLPG
jgi:hypothetical protein